MSKQLKTVLRVSVFLGVGAGILYLLYRGQNAKYQEDCVLKGIAAEDCSLVTKVWQDFLSVDPFWLVAVLIAFMLSNLSRAHRWIMLLHGIGHKARFGTAFFTIMFGYLANLGVPRIGEVLRAAMLSRYEGVPVEKSMGTVVVDRALDVITLLLMIFLAFIFEFKVIYGYFHENFNFDTAAGRYGIPALALMVLGVLWTWWMRERIKKWKIVIRFKETILGFIDGLRSVKRVQQPVLFIAHTLFIWLMYFLMNYMCLKAFVPTEHLGATAALIVFVFGALGIVFPSPGGMGTYHAMIIAALVIYDVSSDDAFSFANILYFSIQIFCNVLFGVIALIVLPLIHRKEQHIAQSG